MKNQVKRHVKAIFFVFLRRHINLSEFQLIFNPAYPTADDG